MNRANEASPTAKMICVSVLLKLNVFRVGQFLGERRPRVDGAKAQLNQNATCHHDPSIHYLLRHGCFLALSPDLKINIRPE
jgi:hypothetical protein